MKNITFEWDEKKALLNLKKHKISFDWARLMSDPDHSERERRYILLGLSKIARLIIVCHCYRSCDSVIRIISAKKATTSEANFYP
jgi:uncharacterized DUF497 family protein